MALIRCKRSPLLKQWFGVNFENRDRVSEAWPSSKTDVSIWVRRRRYGGEHGLENKPSGNNGDPGHGATLTSIIALGFDA